ncbi:MAG TPA: N-acetyltransferase [Roseiarcus sp.]|nr:N-acetyltransferase [Roseiarcus sp.]
MSDLTFTLSPETPEDEAAILHLNARVFGPGRFSRTAYRVREQTAPDLGLSFVARVGPLLVGANAMTAIFIGETPAYLLGPLIVEPVFRSRGIGEALVGASLEAARAAGARLVMLVGDAPYYGRMGFKPAPPGRIVLPGPVDLGRVLVCELVEAAFEGVAGRVRGA